MRFSSGGAGRGGCSPVRAGLLVALCASGCGVSGHIGSGAGVASQSAGNTASGASGGSSSGTAGVATTGASTTTRGGSTSAGGRSSTGSTTGAVTTGRALTSGSTSGATSASTSGATTTSTSGSTSGTTTGATTSSTGGTTGGGPVAVTTFANGPTRDGVFIDHAFTKTALSAAAAAGGLVPDPGFNPQVSANVYASPLFLEGGVNGSDALFVADEQNDVYAFDPQSGATLWTINLGAYVRLSELGCGNIDPIGVTGTPVLDVARHLMYVDAMVDVSDGGGPNHIVSALDLDTGNVRWEIDVDTTLSNFSAHVQNQRPGLLIVNDTLYVAYSGHWGDCGSYRGRVLAIPLNNPVPYAAFETGAQGGGIWAPNAIASDGTSIFTVTGNNNNGDNGVATWDAGLTEAVLRLSADTLAFSYRPTDYFVSHDWQTMDAQDADFSSDGLVLFDLPGTGSGHLALVVGKSRAAWLFDQANLGGLHDPDAPLAMLPSVATGEAAGGMIAYTTATGTYVGFNAPCWVANGHVGVLQVLPGTPPTLQEAFCLDQGGTNGSDQGGAPMVTSSDGTHDYVVWALGAAAGWDSPGNAPVGDNQLHAYDGDTGAPLVSSTGMNHLTHWISPIVAKGSIYVAGNSQVFAFRLP